MGAHLAEGRVEGEELRCFFHGWRFAADGRCTEIPCLEGPLPARPRLRVWPTAERYGMIWVWTGAAPLREPSFVSELEGEEADFSLGNRFAKNCHPNVLMINAIDEHHFRTVHALPNVLDMQDEVLSQSCIRFRNANPVPAQWPFASMLRKLYRSELRYALTYYQASIGQVTLGPDFLHLYLLFALRVGEHGVTEGQSIAITRRRPGALGWLLNRVILTLTKLVGSYFARGDTRVFQTIRFDLQTPIRADRPILRFIAHTEGQRARYFGSWEPVDAPAVAPRASESLGAQQVTH
jgi:phenylpropionate dioxygenase-like ring-hydroxylating dioxygenase large terminal subunit